MDTLTFYRVSAGGRIALEGVVDPDVEFYTAARNDDGTITLKPVNIVTTSGRLKRETADPQD